MGYRNLCDLLRRLARRKVSHILEQHAFIGTREVPHLVFRFRRWIAPIHIALNHQRRGSDGFDGGESRLQGLVSLIRGLCLPTTPISVERDGGPVGILEAFRGGFEFSVAEPAGWTP